MRLRNLPFCKEAYDGALRRMGPVPDRPSAVWLAAYMDRFRWLCVSVPQSGRSTSRGALGKMRAATPTP